MNGLQRRPHYEEVLNAAIRDEKSHRGLLSVPMQNYATNAINSPLFQRVQERLSNDMENQQKQIIEQRSFHDNLTRISVDARIPREDLKWVVENLKGPSPPPPPPTNPKAKQISIMKELRLR